MKVKAATLALFLLWISPNSLFALSESEVVEMRVKGVTLDPSTKSPVVVLETKEDRKSFLPIWIGNAEATSIAIGLEHMKVPRPNTHDLISNILKGIKARIDRITITDLKNNTFYAVISIRLEAQKYEIDSRPSDAIAVALRTDSPIFVSHHVLAKAKSLPPPPEKIAEPTKIMGLHLQELSPELAKLLDLEMSGGILVADVELESPALEAGIKRADVIVKINGTPVHRISDLEELIRGAKRPARFRVEVLREGRPKIVIVKLAS